MNTELRKNAKNDFEQDFFKLMNNAVFVKTMEKVRKHRDVRLVTTKLRRNYLLSEAYYHKTMFFFFKKCISNRVKQIDAFMNKPVYLSLTILEISNTVMYGLWYDYVKLKYGENPKLYYTETDSFIIYIKAGDIYVGIAKDVQTRPLPTRKNRKVIGLMKDKLGGEIVLEFAVLRTKS